MDFNWKEEAMIGSEYFWRRRRQARPTWLSYSTTWKVKNHIVQSQILNDLSFWMESTNSAFYHRLLFCYANFIRWWESHFYYDHVSLSMSNCWNGKATIQTCSLVIDSFLWKLTRFFTFFQLLNTPQNTIVDWYFI